mmetsp:Transcript_24123/g.45105  ORF Transcript_24123/g.45105 Transcript_24123/m.45105 type:complete len:118 (-) Transcript_24123:613-966(-)
MYPAASPIPEEGGKASPRAPAHLIPTHTSATMMAFERSVFNYYRLTRYHPPDDTIWALRTDGSRPSVHTPDGVKYRGSRTLRGTMCASTSPVHFKTRTCTCYPTPGCVVALGTGSIV